MEVRIDPNVGFLAKGEAPGLGVVVPERYRSAGSLFIVFILVMSAYLYRFARRHMAEDEQAARRTADRQPADERSARRMKDGPQAGRLY